MSINKSIFTLTFLNFLGVVVTLAASIITVHYFGTSRSIEIFFAASSLQALAISLSQSGQINEILIPMYHRLSKSEGAASAHTAYSVAINWAIIALSFIALALWLLAPWAANIIVPGFEAADRDSVVLMFRWILPLLPIQVTIALLQGIANAEHSFGRVEAYNIFGQLMGLACIIFFSSSLSTWAMVLSLWVSQIIILGIYITMLHKIGFRYRAAISHPTMSVRSLTSKMGMTFLYAGATQVYALVFSAGLSLLPQGTFATFNYVTRLYSKINSMLLRPVSTVFFTHFSKAFSNNEGLVNLVKSALERTLTIGFLMTTLISCSAYSIIKVIWGSKLFSAEYVNLAAHLMILFMLMLLMSGVGQVLRKLLIANGSIWLVYLSLTFTQIFSAILAFILPKTFGVDGAMAMLIINSALTVGVCALLLRYKMPQLKSFYPIREFNKWIIVSILAASGGMLIESQLMGIAAQSQSRLFAGVTAVSAGAGALLLACLFAWTLRIGDMLKLTQGFINRLTLFFKNQQKGIH